MHGNDLSDQESGLGFGSIDDDSIPLGAAPMQEAAAAETVCRPQDAWRETLRQLSLAKEDAQRIQERAAKDAVGITRIDLDDEAQRRAVVSTIDGYASGEYVNSGHSTLMENSMRSLNSPNNAYARLSKNMLALASEIKGNKPPESLAPQRSLFGKIVDPVKAYFGRWESAQGRINQIADGIFQGKQQLELDNKALALEAEKLREAHKRLKADLAYGLVLLDALEASAERLEHVGQIERVRFLKDEVIFPLEMKVKGLTEMLSVNQISFANMSMIHKNNQLLIIKAENSRCVSLLALKEAVIQAQALANQRNIKDAVETLDTVTNELLRDTSRQMNEQGRAIRNSLLHGGIQLDTFRELYSNAVNAIEEAQRFKEVASEAMRRNLSELAEVIHQADERIRSLKGLPPEATGQSLIE